MKKLRLLILSFSMLLLYTHTGLAQTVYKIEASQVNNPVTADFVLGNPGTAGKEIKVNNKYVTIGGKAVIPVMGEMHFARIPKANWENVILKMKANGINIIASYIFWIHHEEIEGQFDWSDNKNLRAFVQLCQKHQMYVYPRIGPWCHGEARNGGTPDWLLKKNIRTRSNDPQYQKYVDRWFAEIGVQLKGLAYKDGGPVIGVQLENEFVQGKPGEAHILWLKKTAVKYGLDVPLYTVTGWGNASVPKNEVLPLFGAYPDEPWMNDLERNISCKNFAFSTVRNDDNIGNELKQAEEQQQDAIYPYFTCEMGVGIDNTAHRRLFIDGIDGKALVSAKLGSGSNLIGYYVFAGGLNPHGTLTSMEENAIESGGYNTNPAVAYDFQAAIGKSGALAPSYYEVKKTHYFLNEFGNLLAPMDPVFVTTGDELKLAARVKDDQAFVFGINYCRHNINPTIANRRFSIRLKNETITFPSQPLSIPDSTTFIWPLNLKIGNILLKYATAQPLCKINENAAGQWIFIQNMANQPEFCFDAQGIQKLTSSTGRVIKQDGKYIVSNISPGYNAVITIMPVNGAPQQVIILSQKEANQAWLLIDGEKKHFFLSNANLYLHNGMLHASGTQNQVTIKSLDGAKWSNSNLKVSIKKQGLFTVYSYNQPPQRLTAVYTKINPLQDASWLVVNKLEKLTKKQVLNHHFIYKEFNFNKQAAVRSAKLILFTQTDCRVQLNTVMVNQPVINNQLNEVDITGYINAGNNKLLLEFPYTTGEKLMAAKLVIEYLNNDQGAIATDSTWLARDAYNFPSALTGGYPTSKAEISAKPIEVNGTLADYQEYKLTVPTISNNLSNIYLKIYYTGNKGHLYNQGYLIDDNFNNHTFWDIGLNRYSDKLLSKPMKVQIYPLKKEAKVYFDIPSKLGDDLMPEIKSIQVIPEYQTTFKQ